MHESKQTNEEKKIAEKKLNKKGIKSLKAQKKWNQRIESEPKQKKNIWSARMETEKQGQKEGNKSKNVHTKKKSFNVVKWSVGVFLHN